MFFSNFRYEPELFPGLIYRMTKPKIVLLVFVSGKIVLTGKKKSGFISVLHKNAVVLCVIVTAISIHEFVDANESSKYGLKIC